MKRFRGPLMGLIASWTPSWRDAEETAQDVFAEAWVGRARFQGDPDDPGAVGAWLRGIAFHLHQAKQRKRGRMRLVGTDTLDAALSEADEDPDPLGKLAALRTGFRQLKPDQQEVLRMHYLETTTARDVGALLGITQKAVEHRLSRARQALKEIVTREMSPSARRQTR